MEQRFGRGPLNVRDFGGLALRHVASDGICTPCHKQERLTTEERAERHDIGDVHLGIALDQDTRLIVGQVVGKRSVDSAWRFMNRLTNPEASVSLCLAYDNFCWRPGEMRFTPAMATGMTNRL